MHFLLDYFITIETWSERLRSILSSSFVNPVSSSKIMILFIGLRFGLRYVFISLIPPVITAKLSSGETTTEALINGEPKECLHIDHFFVRRLYFSQLIVGFTSVGYIHENWGP